MRIVLNKVLWLLVLPFFVYCGETKICLTMVVHNQKDQVLSCLNSAKNIVDCISIYDIGCTEETVQAIDHFATHNKIPYKIHKTKSENSEQDLAFCVSAAKKTIEELGFSLNTTYLLPLDPNKTVEILSFFSKENLIDDCYSLPEKVPHLVHFSYRPALFRASIPWTCFLEQSTATKMRSLMIDCQENSSANWDELKNHCFFFKKIIKKQPSNKEVLLNLAESYQALKEYQEAIAFYQLRIDQQGDTEEIWFCKFMMGQCYEALNDWEPALYWYLESYQQLPNRAEPIQKIATYYRQKGQNDLAYMFAKVGVDIPLSVDVNLHPAPPFLDYKFDEDLSIAAYYTDFKEDGLIAANNLVIKKNVPGYIKDQAYRNMLFYIEPLKNVSFHPIEFELPIIEVGYDETYHPMNPSLLKTNDGYKVICRGVNYTQKGAKDFKTIDAHGVFRNKNYLLDYSKNFQLLSQSESR